jgi:hypothetical protein
MKSMILQTMALAVLMMFSGGVAIAETVTTTDGRMIQLNSNGTYKFLNKNIEKKYQVVDIENLNLNAEDWIEKMVKVEGYLKVYGTRGDSGLIGKTLSGANNFSVNLISIPKATKRRVLANCKLQCRVGLTGKFLQDGSRDYKIIVDEVIFP